MHYVSKMSLVKQFTVMLFFMIATAYTHSMDVAQTMRLENIDGVDVPAPEAMIDFKLPGGLNIEVAKERESRLREADKYDQMQNDIGVNIVNLARKMDDSLMKPMKDKDERLFLETIEKIRYINLHILPNIQEIINPFIKDQIKKFMNKIVNPNNTYIILPNINETIKSILTQIKCITYIDQLKDIVSDEIYKKLKKNNNIKEIADINKNINNFISYSLPEKEYYRIASSGIPIVTFHQKVMEIGDLEEKIIRVLGNFGLTKDHLKVFTGLKTFSKEELEQEHIKRYPPSEYKLTNPQHMTTTTTIPEQTSSEELRQAKEESLREYRHRKPISSSDNPQHMSTTIPEEVKPEELKKAKEEFLKINKSRKSNPSLSNSQHITTTTILERVDSENEEEKDKK